MTTALQAKQLRQQHLVQAMCPATANAAVSASMPRAALALCLGSRPATTFVAVVRITAMSHLDNKAAHHLCKTSYAAVSIYLVAVTPFVTCPVGKTASQIASRFSKVTLYKPDEEKTSVGKHMFFVYHTHKHTPRASACATVFASC